MGAGLSHILEHMLFKGTEGRGATQVAAEVAALGGQINAYTSFDRTVYYIDGPSASCTGCLDVLMDVVARATIPSDEFERELTGLEKDWYGYPEELLRSHIGEIRTDMDSFTKAESKILENHGYFMADVAIRRHARHLGDISTEFRVPHRDVLEERSVRDALRVSHSRLHFWSRWFD